VLVGAVPLALHGFLTASILTFAHTVGEFGVVLMIDGNIPGVARVASVQIYDHKTFLTRLLNRWRHWTSNAGRKSCPTCSDCMASWIFRCSTSAMRPMRWHSWPTTLC
jgi:ABC-type phosphate transport system permease subunit